MSKTAPRGHSSPLYPAALSLGCLLALGGVARAQMAPRLTAAGVADELDAARAKLVGQTDTAAELDVLARNLRASLASHLDQPLTALGDSDRGLVLRAHAAAAQATGFVDAANGCRADEVRAMAEALAVSVRQLAQTPAENKPMQATIDRLETPDHFPAFALRASDKPIPLALAGAELSDPQCADPQVGLTDVGGGPLPSQPRITGVLPNRVELAWTETATLKPGTYLLHVRPQRKAFLVGCTAQPEAVVAVRLVPAPKFTVDYVVEASCGRAQPATVALGKGRLRPLDGYGASASQAIDTSACVDPMAYRVSATVSYADGATASAGPFEQSADANLTVGLPGGLSLTWDPAVRQLFARSGAPTCKGVR
jgi:hypothetical protein